MQYQVFKKDTQEVIAWIDTDSEEQVLHKEYDIKAGDNLSAIEDYSGSNRMSSSVYQEESKRFNIPESSELLDKCFERPFVTPNGGEKYVKHGDLVYASLGISGEAGEVVDLVKKFIFQKKQVSIEHLEKEIGDLMWYVILMCNTLGISIEEVFKANIDKLTARYPNGFNTYDANHRAEGDI